MHEGHLDQQRQYSKEKKSLSLGSKLMRGCCAQTGIGAGRGVDGESLNLQLSIIPAPDRTCTG